MSRVGRMLAYQPKNRIGEYRLNAHMSPICSGAGLKDPKAMYLQMARKTSEASSEDWSLAYLRLQERIRALVKLGVESSHSELARVWTRSNVTNRNEAKGILFVGLKGSGRWVVRRVLKSHPPASESFLQRANRLANGGEIDSALDLLYDSIDCLLKAGRFTEIDELLDSTDVSSHSVDLLIGLLTSTLPARSRLRNRASFLSKTERYIRAIGQYEDGLLAGL